MNRRYVPAEALVVVLLAANIKMLAFAMLRAYTDVNGGARTATTSLACLGDCQRTVRGLNMPL